MRDEEIAKWAPLREELEIAPVEETQALKEPSDLSPFNVDLPRLFLDTCLGEI